MNIGTKVSVVLASGETYTGQVTKAVRYFGNEVRYEVQGSVPHPFVTIACAESLKSVQPHS